MQLSPFKVRDGLEVLDFTSAVTLLPEEDHDAWTARLEIVKQDRVIFPVFHYTVGTGSYFTIADPTPQVLLAIDLLLDEITTEADRVINEGYKQRGMVTDAKIALGLLPPRPERLGGYGC